MKTIAQLREDFAGIQVMSAAEGKAVVQEDAPIGDVERAQGNAEPFTEFFSKSKVESRV